jgi:hydrogenase small subunit
VGDLLVQTISLRYHPTLMAAAGQTAVDAIGEVYRKGGYLLLVEGGIPRAFGGHTATLWSDQGKEVTAREAVTRLAERARAIISVGACACWGGIPASGSNPTDIVGVRELTGKPAIHIPGCPPHPDWIVAVIAKLIAGSTISLDSVGRPKFLFNTRVHERCPLREAEEASSFGQRGRCLEELGCRGPRTVAPCPAQKFNGGVNWCIGAGAVCLGCTEPTFPGRSAFFRHGGSED